MNTFLILKSKSIDMSNTDFPFSPNENGIVCPDCGGSFREVGLQSGKPSYVLYYCENHVEIAYMEDKEVAGREDEFCHGRINVYRNGKVTRSSEDEMEVLQEAENE